jgi:hypothetical protein
MKGETFAIEASRNGKPNLSVSGVSTELACWKEYGVEREHFLRICVGAKRSANSQRASLTVAEIQVTGLWNPPWLETDPHADDAI